MESPQSDNFQILDQRDIDKRLWQECRSEKDLWSLNGSFHRGERKVMSNIFVKYQDQELDGLEEMQLDRMFVIEFKPYKVIHEYSDDAGLFMIKKTFNAAQWWLLLGQYDRLRHPLIDRLLDQKDIAIIGRTYGGRIVKSKQFIPVCWTCSGKFAKDLAKTSEISQDTQDAELERTLEEMEQVLQESDCKALKATKPTILCIIAKYDTNIGARLEYLIDGIEDGIDGDEDDYWYN